MVLRARRALMPDGWALHQELVIDAGIIKAIREYEGEEYDCDTIVPGLIEQHIHGSMGTDVMYADADEILQWLCKLQPTGVTQVIAGLYTASPEVLRSALKALRQVMYRQSKEKKGALLSGVHLEGPFISGKALGAMDGSKIIPPSVTAYKELVLGYEDMIRLVTLAPELEGASALIEYLVTCGVKVQAGHTMADGEAGLCAFDTGVKGICHFFNASTPIHHRDPGILCEALMRKDVFCECICDMVHVHPTALRLIHFCKGVKRMIVVSDTVATTGLSDGDYVFEGEMIRIRNGQSRTKEGSLNGGGMSLLQAVHALMQIGIDEAEAFWMASATPAEYLGISGGKIECGANAELLCLDAESRVIKTIVGQYEMLGEMYANHWH